MRSPASRAFLLYELLNLSFGEEGVDKSFDNVFVFGGEFFDGAELVEQFFVGELNGHDVIVVDVHDGIGSGIESSQF